SRLPGAAVPLGEGPDTVREKIAAGHSGIRYPPPDEIRGDHAFDAEHLVSADDGDFGADAPGHDRPVLHGRLADDAPRFPADRGVVLVAGRFLRDRAART